MREVYIVDAVRTPVGRMGGTLKNTQAHEMGGLVCKALMERTGLAPELVEEGVIAGGAGEGVLEVLARQGATTPAVTLGIPDRFIGQGPVPQLFADLGLNAEGIAATVREALG